MGDPVFRRQRHVDTGEVRHLMSVDGGASWKVVSSPEEYAAMPAEPAAPPAPAPTPAPDPQQELGPLEQFAQMRVGDLASKAGDTFKRGAESLYDYGVGVSQGLSLGGADELMGALPGTSIPEQQQIVQTSQARSPTAYGFGQAAGGIPLALATAGGSALEQFAAAMLQGGASGFLGADGTPDERAQAGAVGAGVGGALSGAATGVGKAASAIRPFVSELGDRAASRVVETGAALGNLADKHGLEFATHEVGRGLERMAPPHLIPRNARWFENQLKPIAEAKGAAVGDAVDAATNEVPDAILANDLFSQMQAQRGQISNKTNLPSQRDASSADDLIALTEQHYGNRQYLSPRDLHSMKVDMQDVGWPNDATKADPTGREQLLHQRMSRVPRQALDDAVNTLALPETAASYQNAKEDYAMADTLLSGAHGKAVAQERRANESGLGGFLKATASPLLDREPDATRMAIRGAESGLGSLEQWASSMSGPGASASAQGSGSVKADLQNQKQERERIQGESRGHLLEDVIKQAIATDSTVLGPYEGRFLEAHGKSDPMAISNLLSELESDDQWRMSVRPQLQQMTARRRGSR